MTRDKPAADPITARAVSVDRTPGANKTERRYADHLDQRIDVVRWWWKPGSIRIAPSLFYQPDYLVQTSDGTLELVDVKGAKGERFWCEEDAWVKIKTVAAMYPFRMCVSWERKSIWHHETVGPTREALS